MADNPKRWDIMTYRPTTGNKPEAFRIGRAFLGNRPGVINIKLEVLPTPNVCNAEGFQETWAVLVPYESDEQTRNR